MCKNDVEIRCGHFQKIVNNCILRNKLTKKYADHSALCVGHAHIYLYFYIINIRLNYWGWTRATY